MLDEQSYLIAIYTYLGAGALMLLCLAFWLWRRLPASLLALLLLLAAALLLTPAYPYPDSATMAPALVVAGFQFLTEGPQAAGHTLGLLGKMGAAAVVLALLLRLSVLRPRRRPADPADPEAEA